MFISIAFFERFGAKSCPKSFAISPPSYNAVTSYMHADNALKFFNDVKCKGPYTDHVDKQRGGGVSQMSSLLHKGYVVNVSTRGVKNVQNPVNEIYERPLKKRVQFYFSAMHRKRILTPT